MRRRAGEVAAEPVLIVPAWIMKYYILDLSPANSLVNYLVERGSHRFHDLLAQSRTAEDRELGLDDYLRLGVLDALKAVQTIIPECKVNARRLLSGRHAAVDRCGFSGAGG